MKLVLIQPPIEDFYHTPVRLVPLGLGYLKAAVKQYLPEVEVVIKDFHQGWGRRTIPLPDDLAYLKGLLCLAGPEPFFHLFSLLPFRG